MDPFLWAYGLMAREAGADDGSGARSPRDPGLLARYREALDLSLVETGSLALAAWDEGQVPACPMRARLDILRVLAVAARSAPGGWSEERGRLVRLAERFEIPPMECANVLVNVVEGGKEARSGLRLSRRTLLYAAGGLGGILAAVGLGARVLGGGERQRRFAGFEERFADALLLIEVECDLILGTGRVPYRSIGMGFFTSEEGLIVTNKHVVQPWKFVAEVVRKLEGGYVLDQDSVQLRAWRADGLRMADRGRFDASAAFRTENDSLAIAHLTPDSTTRRSVALPEGGVHRGVYHVLDRSNVALLKARVNEPVHAIELLPGEVAGSQRVMALGLDLPRPGARRKEVRVRSSAARVQEGRGGTLKLTVSVPAECSGGPVLDAEGRAVGVATHRLGDPQGARCVPAQAILDLTRLGG